MALPYKVSVIGSGAVRRATGFVWVCGRCVAWVRGVALAAWLKPCPSPDFGGYCSLGSLGMLSIVDVILAASHFSHRTREMGHPAEKGTEFELGGLRLM